MQTQQMYACVHEETNKQIHAQLKLYTCVSLYARIEPGICNEHFIPAIRNLQPSHDTFPNRKPPNPYPKPPKPVQTLRNPMKPCRKPDLTNLQEGGREVSLKGPNHDPSRKWVAFIIRIGFRSNLHGYSLEKLYRESRRCP